jgi:RND family efflux transporter MFP subunit
MRQLALTPLAPLALLAGCGTATPAPTPTPSVAVTVQRITRGSAPEWLTAYGSATPSVTGTQTLSLQLSGQLTGLSITPGAAVRAGQLLAVFNTEPSSLGTFQEALTTLDAARRQRDTVAQLLAQQLATQDQLTQAEKAVGVAQAQVAALRSEGAGQPVRRLVAPFDGVVTAVSAAQGDRVQPGAPLVTVARTGGIVATIGLDPATIARLHIGQTARITRLNGGPPIVGQVIRVDSVLNLRTRLIDVDLSFPVGALLPNEAVRGEIAVGQVAGWLVPHRAVVTAGGPTRIFQVAGGKARAVNVSVRLAGDTVDVVEGAPDPRLPLIVDGAYQVQEGDAVRAGGG